MSQTRGLKALIAFARFWSLASIVFVLLFVFGELFSGHGPSPTPGEWVGLAFFPGGVIIGLIIAWFRKGLGGSLALASLFAFYVWNLLARGTLPRGPYLILVAAPGFLFLMAWMLSRPNNQVRHA